MYSHKIRVRYAETDAMAVAHHSSYWLWFEEARVEFLNTNNINYSDLEKQGFFLPVAESYCKYLTPAHFNEVLIVNCFVTKIGGASVKIEYEIINEKNQNVAKAYTVHPIVNEQGHIVKMPEKIKKEFQKILE